MADTNLYWGLRGTFAERRAKLAAFSREHLEAAILDSEYNDFLKSWADVPEGEKHPHGRSRRLPYVGWFWRHLRFSEGTLPIGDCGQFIGFIANNKWDYPERQLTADEFAAVMAIIDDAMRLGEAGGLVTDIQDNIRAKLDELWTYLQTLSIDDLSSSRSEKGESQ